MLAPPLLIVRPAGVWNSRAPLHNFLSYGHEITRDYSVLTLAIARVRYELAHRAEGDRKTSVRKYLGVESSGPVAVKAFDRYRRSWRSLTSRYEEQPSFDGFEDDLAVAVYAVRESAVARYSAAFETFFQCWALNMLLAYVESGKELPAPARALAEQFSPFRQRFMIPGAPAILEAFPDIDVALTKLPHVHTDPISGAAIDAVGAGLKRHLHRGLLIRLSMMEECIIILDEELSKAQTPLDSYLSIRLTLFLNAYYLNLAGSFDNVAWALIYHHSLINNVDEDEPKHRKFAQLLGKGFLSELRKKHLDQLSDTLEPFRDWYWEMREFRDPAAHRIPLSVPRSTYSEKDVREYERLDKEAAELIAKGELESGMSLIHQSYRLGEYMPIFISETSRIKRYDLAGRINLDHGNWQKMLEAVFEMGF